VTFLAGMAATALVVLAAVAVGALVAGRRTATVEARFDRLLTAREAESARVLNLLLSRDVQAFAVLQQQTGHSPAPAPPPVADEAWDGRREVTYEFPDDIPDSFDAAAVGVARAGG
jgi:hypothetical protein